MFQLTLSTGKQTQGAMFTDPRAGIVAFLPLCDAYIKGMAKANAKSKPPTAATSPTRP
jgi:hypothetical protein